jgi:hypothetical protein
MTNWKEIEKEKSIYGIIARHDLKSENRIITRILRKLWNQGYNLGQIETIKMILETDLNYYLDKCDSDNEIINEVLHG